MSQPRPKSKHVQQHFTGVFESVECGMCGQLEKELKLLKCGDKICKRCLSHLILEAATRDEKDIKCPIHHDLTSATTEVPSIFYGMLECELCGEQKPVTDIWWCGSCPSYFCSHCHITDHSSKLHPNIVKWDSGIPVQQASHFLHSSTALGNDPEEEKRRGFETLLQGFLERVGNLVLEKVSPPSPSEGEGYEQSLARLLQAHYAPSGAGTSSQAFSHPDSISQLTKVAEKALSLAKVPLPKKESGYSAYKACSEKLERIEPESMARLIIAKISRPPRSPEVPREKPPRPPLPPSSPPPQFHSLHSLEGGDEEDNTPLVPTSRYSLNTPIPDISDGKVNLGGDWWKFSQESVLDQAGTGGSRFGLDNIKEDQIKTTTNDHRLSSSSLRETVNGGESRIVFDFDAQVENKELDSTLTEDGVGAEDRDSLEGSKSKKDLMTRFKSKLSKKKKTL